MMVIKNATKLLVLITLLASCAKIKITTPASRFILPEAKGKLLSGTVRMEQQAGTEGTVDFSGDRTNNPLELRNNVTPLALSAELGLIEKMDLVVKGNADSTSVYMLKYQLMGASKKDAAAGNQSLSVGIGYGSSETEQIESDSSAFNNQNDEYDADITEQLIDLTVIYGYRPEEDTLVYANLSAQKQNIQLKLDGDSSAPLNGEEFEINTWAYGLALGAVRYWDDYNFMLELAAQRTDYNNNDPTTFGFFTMALGKTWD